MVKRSDSTFEPALLQPLSVLLPTEEQTWLLQACLWPGEQGARAWTKWSERIDDPAVFLREEIDGVKGLLPLLFHSLQQKKVLAARRFQTYLRTAYARDEIRSRSYGSICQELISAFASAGIP